MSSDLCFLTATELARRIRVRDVSVTEVVQAHLAQVERVNPKVNAIVTLTAERALADARAKDAALARGEAAGPLFGLPVAHKDLVPTRGIRTTFGSPIYRDHVPDQDALLVERLRAAGAVTIGKTNTPEFGAGSQTFNEVFGRTLNPYDPTKTCGGSSGGAAVALACGMVPIADGSDTGGSLRNPASFCNVVGMRGAPGRVPPWPTDTPWSTLHVPGPMARTVADVALMLSAMAGPDPRSPIAIAEPGDRFRAPLGRDFKGVRVAWSRDLGGLPVDRRVTAALDAQRATFDALGCHVEDGQPDFAEARQIFQVLRALNFATRYGPLLAQRRHQTIHGVHDLSAAAVVQCDLKKQTGVLRGLFLRVPQLALHARIEAVDAPDRDEADVVLHQRGELLPQILLEQHHQRRYFVARTLPVLD